jgi:hypothetical protein
MIRVPHKPAARVAYAAPSGAQQPEWITSRQRSRPLWENSDTSVNTTDQAEEATDATPPETAALAAAAQPAESGLRAYGCAYHSKAQRLAISRPKERAIMRFCSHSCLRRVDYAEDGTGLIAQEAGDYEIVFELCVAVKAASPVIFELAAGEEKIPGGTVTAILPGGTRQYRCSLMAALRAGDRIGVVMTSASVCEAEFAANGAKLMIKKLD